MDVWLRRTTPLVMLVLAGLVWFESYLPGHDYVVREFGDKFVLRFVLGVLCLYVLMLVIERHRMEQLFTQVIGQLRNLRGAAGSEDASLVSPSDAEAKREAVQILIAALGSEDGNIRASALVNLQRLTGQSLGDDQAAWQKWLAESGKPGA